MARLKLALANVDAAIDATGESVPPLRLGVLPVVSMRLLGPAVARLRQEGQSMRLEVRESTVSMLLKEVREGRLDCAICRIESDQRTLDDLQYIPLMKEGLAIAAACDHPLVRLRRAVTLTQLADQAWVLAPDGSSTRQAFDRAFAEAGQMPPRPEIESMSFHTNLQLIAHTHLLTVAPESATQMAALQGLVRAVRTDIVFAPTQLVFVSSHAALNMPGIAALYRALAWAAKRPPAVR